MPSANDAAMLQALAEGVEHARAEAAREWGAERLPLLVDAALRAKFNSQKAKWSAAIAQAWESAALTRDQFASAERHAAGMIKAYAALAVAASEAGHRPIKPHVFEALLADGSVLAVVETNDEAAHVIQSGRALHVYTMAELAYLVDALLPEALQLGKGHFPGAKFQASTRFEADTGWTRDGDAIPFPVGSAAA